MAKSSKAKQPIDKSVNITGCHISNLDQEKMAAIEALARAAEANADAILEIAKGISQGGAVGIMVKQLPS